MTLEQVQVQTPCNVDFAAMSGDAAARFCGQCQKQVYNLSAMTRSEAEALVCKAKGELCVRFAKDASGQVVTKPERVNVAGPPVLVLPLMLMLGLVTFALAAFGWEWQAFKEQQNATMWMMGSMLLPSDD